MSKLAAVIGSFVVVTIVGCANPIRERQEASSKGAKCGPYGTESWSTKKEVVIASGVLQFGDSATWEKDGIYRIRKVEVNLKGRFKTGVSAHAVISGMDLDKGANTRVYVGVCSVTGKPPHKVEFFARCWDDTRVYALEAHYFIIGGVQVSEDRDQGPAARDQP